MTGARPTVLPMADFDITGPLPTGTVLLEASAGTGKTWTIAALVTRYVAEGVVTLPQMLIVTFGRSASEELRARVREQLVVAERELAAAVADRPQEPEDALIALLTDAPIEELHQRHRRIRAALTHFDAATIATTHQFCHQVLRSLGTAGATDSGATLIEDVDDLLVEVVDDIYLRGFGRDDKAPSFTRKEALEIARAVVGDVHAELRPSAAEPGSPAARRVGFARAVREEIDARKRRLQVMHYNDLLTQLAEALEEDDSPASQRMRQRWQVVLVDEFQDTDPIQWRVLDRAFSGQARAMILIGDPKQAIYAFRGGDVVTYLAAAATANDRRTLPRNYRSDAPLVDALGVLLGGAQLGDPQIVVHPVSPHRSEWRLAGSRVQAPVRLRQVLRDDHLGGSVAINAVRRYVASDLAQDIAALLTSDATFCGRPIEARDIAVLAFRGKDLLDAQAALRALGIPAIVGGGSSVFESRAAKAWLTLLEALVAPHRSARTRAAALTDLFGYDVESLDTVAEDGQVETLDDELAQRCRDLAAIYARQGIAGVFEDLSARGLAARILRQVGGERSITDLQHVAQLLHEAARRDNLGLASLLTWLRAAMAEDARRSSGARSRRLDSDAAAVQLVTIHGSKGLQYPIVYLPALMSRFVSPTPTAPLLYHEAPPERARSLDVAGDLPSNPTWHDAVERWRIEEAGESLRLLYVAMTRAQSQVVTWWAASGKNTAPSALHRLLFGRAPGAEGADAEGVPDKVPLPSDDAATAAVLQAWADAGAFALERADLAQGRPAAPAPPAPLLTLAAWTRQIDQAWRRTSYTALSTPPETHTTGAGDGMHATAGARLTFGGGGLGTTLVDSEPEVVPRADEPELPELVPPERPGLPGLELDDLGVAVAGADTPSPMADLPVGATFGSLVHAVLEHADPKATDLRAELLDHIRAQLVEWPVEDLDVDLLADALVAVCDTPLGPLAGSTTLRQIGLPDRLSELSFELPLSGGDEQPAGALAGPEVTLGDLAPLLHAYLPVGDPVRSWGDVLRTSPDLAAQPLRGYLTGSIDVVLRTGGRYLVVDYKTNWLGPIDEPLTAASYRPELLAAAMSHSSYPLQAVLYAVVAHRFLRWRLPGYDPDQHLGGVLYLYVRGMCGPDTPVVDGHPCGVFSWRPPVALVEAISDLLDGRVSEVAGR